jgi:DNA-binding NarL/FixJ family response regulator
MGGNSVPSVLIADDHVVVRSGLRTILEAQPNCEVVAEAADGKEAIVKAIETKPDIAVIDYSMPIINGVEVTRQILSQLPKTEVLILTMHDNEGVIQQALQAGARGYVLKTDATKHFLAAIEALASHKPFFTSKISEALLTSFLKHPEDASSLTGRERCIVGLVAQGHTNKQIAHELNIGQKTVETHRGAIKRKLNVSSSAEIVRYAIRNRLAEA